MKLKLIAMLFLATLVMYATPTCAGLVTSGAINVTAINGAGCTADGLLFNDFQYGVFGGSGSPEVDLTQGGVGTYDGFTTLNLNPNLNGLTGITDIHLTFTVSGLEAGGFLYNSGLLSMITEQVCTGSEDLAGNCTGGGLAWNTLDADEQYSTCVGNLAGGSGSNSACSYGAGVGAVSVWEDISIGQGGQQTSYTVGFEGAAPVAEVPSMMLFGLGLACLGIRLIRLSSKRVVG